MMEEWCREREERRGGESVEEVVASWLEAYERVVEGSIGWRKKRTGKKRSWYDTEVARWNKEMRVVVQEWMRETDEEKKGVLGEKKRVIRSERQREIRRVRTRRMMEKMRMMERTVGPGRGGDLMRLLQE